MELCILYTCRGEIENLKKETACATATAEKEKTKQANIALQKAIKLTEERYNNLQ